MKQRDKNIRGLTLGRMLGIPFASLHNEDIPTLSENLIMSCAEKFKQHFYGSCNLCYLNVVLWHCTGAVGLLPCRDSFADY